QSRLGAGRPHFQGKVLAFKVPKFPQSPSKCGDVRGDFGGGGREEYAYPIVSCCRLGVGVERRREKANDDGDDGHDRPHDSRLSPGRNLWLITRAACASNVGVHLRQTERPQGGRSTSGGTACSAPLGSLDHLVCLQQQGRWDRQTKRLGSLEIQHKFELRGLLDGKVSWLLRP